MRKSFLFFFIIIFLLILVSFTLAPQRVYAGPGPREGRLLEVSYPEIEGFRPERVTTPVPEYVKYIFNFLIWGSGLIALLVLTYGGFQYMTSAGSPEKVRAAKDQISAALLGLLILFSSYLLLIWINPGLVIFHLPRLRPIISTLPPGVLLCKEVVTTPGGGDAIFRAWDLIDEYKYDNPPIERQREIKEELDLILEDISEKCYTVLSKGDIKADFDNEVRAVYFIPDIRDIEIDGGWTWDSAEYGAILYKKRNYEDNSLPMYGHLIDPHGEVRPYRRPVTAAFEPSSIVPFQLIYEPDESWEVILYEEANFNMGFVGKRTLPANAPPGYRLPGDYWWREIDLPWSPQSIEVEGDLLAVLYESRNGPYGPSDSFFGEDDPNLLDNHNIVDWEQVAWCPGRRTLRGCAVAAAKLLAIIAARPY